MVHIAFWLGRFAFIALAIIQCVSFAMYPAQYEHSNAWYLILILYLPTILMWSFVMCNEGNLRWLFLVWAFYVVALVVNIGIIFGLVEDKLDSEKFFGPNILKITLCISPLLLLLLLNTATDSVKYQELVAKLSFGLTLDLFDGIEMLEVVLEENERSHGIPGGFEKAIIAFACISFLLSPLQMMENKLRRRESEVRLCVATFRISLQILVVNSTFLGLRLALFLKYGRDASIFIAKNGITIINCLLEICSIFECCGFDD